jgi:serine phosphatase RsbU (regulator of sigma subunit)
LHEQPLEAGDTLLLLTDGLPEQQNPSGEMFGYPRLREQFGAVARDAPEEIISRLVGAAEAWMEGTLQVDDMTLLVVRVVQ